MDGSHCHLASGLMGLDGSIQLACERSDTILQGRRQIAKAVVQISTDDVRRDLTILMASYLVGLLFHCGIRDWRIPSTFDDLLSELE